MWRFDGVIDGSVKLQAEGEHSFKIFLFLLDRNFGANLVDPIKDTLHGHRIVGIELELSIGNVHQSSWRLSGNGPVQAAGLALAIEAVLFQVVPAHFLGLVKVGCIITIRDL